jgi:hypothetical protein
MDHLKSALCRLVATYPISSAMGLIWIVFYLITAPVPAYVPVDNELAEISGLPIFQEIQTIKNSQTYFSVDGVILHCVSGTLGGTNGCSYLAEKLGIGIPVRVKYFRRPTRVLTTANMVYTVEQYGSLAVSAEDTLFLQQHAYDSGRKLSVIVSLGWGFLVLIGFYLDRLRIRSSKSNGPPS